VLTTDAEADGRYFAAHLKPANVKAHRRDRRLTRNQNGKRKVVVIIREVAIPSRQVSIRKAKLLHSFERLCIPTKQHHGITYMIVSRSRKSTIRRHTASVARALAWLKNTSPVFVVPSSEFTAISPVRVSAGPRRSPHGARTIGASRTKIG
jgi:hypothetical protein